MTSMHCFCGLSRLSHWTFIPHSRQCALNTHVQEINHAPSLYKDIHVDIFMYHHVLHKIHIVCMLFGWMCSKTWSINLCRDGASSSTGMGLALNRPFVNIFFRGCCDFFFEWKICTLARLGMFFFSSLKHVNLKRNRKENSSKVFLYVLREHFRHWIASREKDRKSFLIISVAR